MHIEGGTVSLMPHHSRVCTKREARATDASPQQGAHTEGGTVSLMPHHSKVCTQREAQCH